MAEINIKRKNSPVWAWILGLLVLVAAGVIIYYMVKDDTAAGDPATETVHSTPANNNENY